MQWILLDDTYCIAIGAVDVKCVEECIKVGRNFIDEFCDFKGSS